MTLLLKLKSQPILTAKDLDQATDAELEVWKVMLESGFV